jgi:ribosomal peptide maturation radical SAM protein 1
MQQTVPSLALARRIKEKNPAIKIVFGGPSASDPMGPEMLRSFSELDYIIEGEADGVISQFVTEIRAGITRPELPGVWSRSGDGEVSRMRPPIPFHDLDSLPTPDYCPFFHQVELLELHHIAPFIPFETSRGCWWGAKHHCTFCGISDDILRFRSKSDATVLNEIMTLSARHSLPDFFAVDSIINYKFFRSLLPQLASLRQTENLDLAFFFECKSNLRRDHVDVFRRGGVREVQPGIESFSDHILQLMDKGTTAARQVQCLKLLAESKIEVAWNLIFANPGEVPEDYDEIISTIPFLHHLPPPHEGGYIPMQINRYAPYHERPSDFGIKNIRPREYYKIIFPREGVDLEKVAFYFDYDLIDAKPERLDSDYDRLNAALDQWRRCYRDSSLTQARGPGFVRIVDRRVTDDWPDEAATHPESAVTITGLMYELFVACDEVRTLNELKSLMIDRASGEEIEAIVERMVSARIVYRSRSDQLVNLPLLSPSDPLPEGITNDELGSSLRPQLESVLP